MKLLLVLLSQTAVAFADPWTTPGPGFACYCRPDPPICASNGVTYSGECNMRCANNWIPEKLYVVHDGPCP
ncbi:unnamed protein product, partial [Iphiclides podalirius]